MVHHPRVSMFPASVWGEMLFYGQTNGNMKERDANVLCASDKIQTEKIKLKAPPLEEGCISESSRVMLLTLQTSCASPGAGLAHGCETRVVPLTLGLMLCCYCLETLTNF